MVKSLVVCLAAIAASPLSLMCQAPAYTISTVAGGGNDDTKADGSLALNDSFGNPIGIAVDAGGNFYFTTAVTIYSPVFETTSAGTLQTVAGNAVLGDGYSGDGSPALGSPLSLPHGLAIDGAGNLYIADSGNNRVRKVDGSGIITTVAGGGTTAAALGDGGPATNALLEPFDVKVDASGNLYIADYANNRVRMVDQSGNISTVAVGATSLL
jgi:sugar lactone lactonase YvrE